MFLVLREGGRDSTTLLLSIDTKGPRVTKMMANRVAWWVESTKCRTHTIHSALSIFMGFFCFSSFLFLSSVISFIFFLAYFLWFTHLLFSRAQQYVWNFTRRSLQHGVYDIIVMPVRVRKLSDYARHYKTTIHTPHEIRAVEEYITQLANTIRS